VRSGGGKAKGSTFEREVCKRLSLWVSSGEREDVFWRSAMSGGRSTVAMKNRGVLQHAGAGDVSAIAALGERLLDYAIVECKAYANLDVLSGILKDTGKLRKFWEVLLTQAVKYDREPLMIARQNQFPTFMMMRPPALKAFGLDYGYCVAVFPRWDCVLIFFDAFLREACVPRARLALVKPGRQKL